MTANNKNPDQFLIDVFKAKGKCFDCETSKTLEWWPFYINGCKGCEQRMLESAREENGA